jgi:hypothetical protein
MSIAELTTKRDEYKKQIEGLELPFRTAIEPDFVAPKYIQISDASEQCYHSFNKLNMSIAKLESKDEQKVLHLECYKNTYGLLRFIENEVDTEFCLDILRESEPFRRLFNHFSRWCTEVERKYDIELESEKSLRRNQEFLKIVKEHVE